MNELSPLFITISVICAVLMYLHLLFVPGFSGLILSAVFAVCGIASAHLSSREGTSYSSANHTAGTYTRRTA